MGWHLVPFLPLVDLDDLLGVDGEPLVRVHHHAKQARVGLVQKVWGEVWEHGNHLHISGQSSISLWCCATRTPRSGRLSLPCPPVCRTLEGSFFAGRPSAQTSSLTSPVSPPPPPPPALSWSWSRLQSPAAREAPIPGASETIQPGWPDRRKSSCPPPETSGQDRSYPRQPCCFKSQE